MALNRSRPAPPWEGDYCAYFEARQRQFMRTAYAILGRWQLAEDATQTTFTQLYVHWPRIRERTREAYARRVLVNTCLALARGRRRELLVEDVPDAPDDEVSHLSHDERLDLMSALRGLSPRDRAVLALRYLSDLSVAEVSEVLQLPEGTVKSQTARALSRLTPATREVSS